jgi:hypothetical protein
MWQGTGEECTTINCIICTLTKYYPGDEIKKNEMDRACGTYRGQGRCIQDNGGGNMIAGDHFEGRGIDGSIILK